MSLGSAALRAALIIQNWYRGYRARLRARQRYALAIFQSIEYADEQRQMQNGLPSESNPYIFNGDFVDRGKNSMEILMILFLLFYEKQKLVLLEGSRRVSAIESSAIRILKERMISRKTDLIRAFQSHDVRKTGKLSMAQWALIMENVLGLNLPWRTLGSHLVNIDKNGNIDYASSFQDIRIGKSMKEVQSTLIETLYRYRSDLQIIFNIVDSDHSGLISVGEFRAMWKLFTSHYNVRIDDSELDELLNTMDLNKDGSIDFNEFLKAFCVVHKFEKLSKSSHNLAKQE
ncbi:Serine/threonine-protein phosphatase with EF-hands 1 [Tupaia chinensis]|uniref:Serine/threonine-protein phosphatase with EF-hands 1 n=1 Tax=Tupaia chinensis TaxID=246437 RepID=L9JI15_TUPCH|nr:Serine/threonine-protein phosphatase with EF-hands 1 [Tupaia chinensis]